MDIVVHQDRGGGSDTAEKEKHSAIFLLELEGLGSFWVDKEVQNLLVYARFTTGNDEVGQFLGREIPRSGEGIEVKNLFIDGNSRI